MKLKHIAIIMDGNGRSGKKNFLSRISGHNKGVQTLEDTIINCMNNNIEILTVYAFSTENWNRSSFEVNSLIDMFNEFLIKKANKLNEENIKLIITGRKDKLPLKLIDNINKTCKMLENNTKFILNICFDYGSRQEILDAVNLIIKDKLDYVDENIFNKYLYTNISYPDLVIRTGGELRLSNFLLWQIAYSELYFTNCLWPDFDEFELKKAIDSYNSRERRFGQVYDE